MSKWETIGQIGVDSGTIMVIDPCYVVPDEDWGDWCAEYQSQGGFNKRGVETSGGGVAVTTLHGDGLYNVEAKRDYYGRIVEIRVRFDWDEENDY